MAKKVLWLFLSWFFTLILVNLSCSGMTPTNGEQEQEEEEGEQEEEPLELGPDKLNTSDLKLLPRLDGTYIANAFFTYDSGEFMYRDYRMYYEYDRSSLSDDQVMNHYKDILNQAGFVQTYERYPAGFAFDMRFDTNTPLGESRIESILINAQQDEDDIRRGVIDIRIIAQDEITERCFTNSIVIIR